MSKQKMASLPVKGETMTALNIVIENAVKFQNTTQPVRILYFDGSKGKRKQPKIGVRRGMLQRKLQAKKWKENDQLRAKEFIYSLLKGTADTDSFMLAPADLVLESLIEEAHDASEESLREYIEETIEDIKEDMADGVKLYLLDGQNRLFLAIIPFIDNKFARPADPLVAVDTATGERYSLAGKRYKNLPDGLKKFFDNIEVYLHVAVKGDIKSLIKALIAKNSNVAWIEWQRMLTDNTFSAFRKQISAVLVDDETDSDSGEDNFVVDNVFDKITNALYDLEVDGYERFISELLIWMKTGFQPKKDSTNMQSQFFKGEDGNTISKKIVASLKEYLREYASAAPKTPNVTHILVRNYIMLRYAMDNPKKFQKITLPNWKIEKEAEFVAQYLLASKACNDDPNAKVSVKDENGKHVKWDKVPGYLPFANSDYTKELLLDRIKILSQKLITMEDQFTTKNIVTKLSSDSMPSVEQVALKNDMKDYKGRTVYGVDVISNVPDRGHEKAKATGGSNVDLQLQKPRSNKTYGKNPLPKIKQSK